MTATQRQVLISTEKSTLWVAPDYTTDLYPHLKDVFTYEEPPIMVMGRQCRQRRDVAFYSDESEGYRYSGAMMSSLPLDSSPILKWLLPLVNRSLDTKFNGILVNRYRNGEKYLSAHSDSEKGLDKDKQMVVGLCYGPGTRKFRIREKRTKRIVMDIEHRPCMLIVMEGGFQSEFTHEIPIQKGVKDERISITFRHHNV